MGIQQSDLILRSCLLAGLADLRANPWILIDIFSQCAEDSVLQREFGRAEIQRATNWFLKTGVPVVMQHRMDDVNLPCISVSLLSSSERIAESVLSDYAEDQAMDEDQLLTLNDISSQPIVILGPFTPAQYIQDTGLITLPEGFTTNLVVRGQAIKDKQTNTTYPIVAVVDDNTFQIEAGVVANFIDAVVLPQFATPNVIRHRTMFMEMYQIGCHVSGDPSELLWLHSLVSYCLLKYKLDYLEKRGLTRITFASSDFTKAAMYLPQNIYSRFVTVTAIVEHNWLQEVAPRMEGLGAGSLRIMDGGLTPPDVFENEVQNQGWIMDEDPDVPDDDNLM